MEKIIREILTDIYAIDEGLRQYEKELTEIIQALINSESLIQPDENYKKALREKVMAQIGDIIKEKRKENNQNGEEISFLNQFKVFLKPAYGVSLAVLLLIGFFGWKIFFSPKGINLSKTANRVEFNLKPVDKDITGIDPQAGFVLSASKKISQEEIQKILVFNPRINFKVEEYKDKSALVQSAQANEDDSTAGNKEFKTNYKIVLADELGADEILKATISDELADRNYQWAFQVKAPFRIVESYPRDKATSVAINSTVELFFNRELTEEAKNYFQIEPQIDGRLEVKGRALIFHPAKNLELEKIHQIKIKTGLGNKESEEKITEEYKLSFETGFAEDNEEYFYFSDSQSLLETTPNQKPRIGIHFSGQEENREDFKINGYYLGDGQSFMEKYLASRNWNNSWSYYNKEYFSGAYASLLDKMEKEFSVEVEEEELISEEWQGAFWEFENNPQEGFYLLEIVNKNGKKDYAWLKSSPIINYLTFGDRNGLIWLYDFEKKEFVSDAKIQIVDSNQQLHSLGKTNQDGSLNFDLPDFMLDKEEEMTKFILVEDGENLSVVLPLNSPNNNFENRFWKYVATDKGIYYPTDKVNFWAVIKEREGDTLKEEKIKVGIYKEYPENYYSQKIVAQPLVYDYFELSSSGTIKGSLDFQSLQSGSYYLVFTTETGQLIESKNFEIYEYIKPAYQIEVKSQKKGIYYGEQAIFDVEAKFFDGTPVKNLKLKSTADCWNCENFEGEKELTLNEEGRGTIIYNTSLNQRELEKALKNSKDTSLPLDDQLSVEVYPALGEDGDIWGASHLEVFQSNFVAKIDIEDKEKDKTGEKKFDFKINLKKGELEKMAESYGQYEYQEGQPKELETVKNWPVKIKVTKFIRKEKEDGTYYDFITKTERKKYQYEEEELSEDELEGKTDNQGNWNFDYSLEQNENIWYNILVYGKDERSAIFGNSWHNFSRVYPNNNPNPNLDLSLSGGSSKDKWGVERFKIGDDIKVEAIPPKEIELIEQKKLFYRFQNDIEESIVVDKNEWNSSFQKEFAPLMRFAGVAITPYGFIEGEEIANFDEREKGLEVKIIPEKESYRPGDKVKGKIMVKNKNNQPVESEIGWLVADEALYENTSDWNGNILNKVYERFWIRMEKIITKFNYLDVGGAGGGGDGIRKTFKDVIVFDALKTNANGEAEFEFELPDNLTSWRLSAYAFNSGELEAGDSFKNINVRIPYFLDVVLGENFIQGDQPIMKIRFFGTEYKKGDVTVYQVECPALDLKKNGETAEKEIEVPISQLKTGNYEIKISVKSNNKEDVLIKKIKVIPARNQKIDMAVYSISKDLSNIKGNKEGFTHLVFSDGGSGKFYSTLLQYNYTNGPRLDQLAGSFLAENLIFEYFGQGRKDVNFPLEEFYRSNDQGELTGLSLLPKGEGNLEISVKTLDAVGEYMGGAKLEKYFKDSMTDKKADIHRVAQALYGLAILNKPVLNQIEAVKGYEKELNIQDKIYLGLAQANSGDVEGSRDYYLKEIKKEIIFKDGMGYLFHKENKAIDVKLSALLTVLVAKIQMENDFNQLWKCVSQNNPENDLDVLEEVLAIRNALTWIDKEEASFLLETVKRKEKIELKQGKIKEITLSVEELNSLKFSQISGQPLVASYFESSIDKREIINSAQDLSFETSFWVEGKKVDNFKEGDLVKIQLRPRLSSAVASDYQIIYSLPSGLRPSTGVFGLGNFYRDYNLEEKAEVDECHPVWYPNRYQGNRAYLNFNPDNFKKANQRCADFSLNFYARVAVKGTYILDSSALQSVSDPDRIFITEPKTIEIK